MRTIVESLIAKFVEQVLELLRQRARERIAALPSLARRATPPAQTRSRRKRRRGPEPTFERHLPASAVAVHEIVDPGALLEAAPRSEPGKVAPVRKWRAARRTASAPPPPPSVATVREGEMLLRASGSGVVVRRQKGASASEAAGPAVSGGRAEVAESPPVSTDRLAIQPAVLTNEVGADAAGLLSVGGDRTGT